jgi:hypothetical protein
MIKRRVQFDWKTLQNKEMPVWAYNFLARSEIGLCLKYIKKNSRKESLPVIVQNFGEPYILEHIYCNQSGDVVFFWENKEEMAKFVKTWGDA